MNISLKKIIAIFVAVNLNIREPPKRKESYNNIIIIIMIIIIIFKHFSEINWFQHKLK